MSKRLLTLIVTVLMLLAVFGVTQAQGNTPAAVDGTSNTVIFAQPAPASVNGIIMRDGGICDPIRHMGC
jgi:hypothetical protein